MRRGLSRGLLLLGLLAAAAAWVWFKSPEFLPAELRIRNPHSADYAPTLYRWKDDQGRSQVTDAPPTDGRPYERVQIDPRTNIVPGL